MIRSKWRESYRMTGNTVLMIAALVSMVQCTPTSGTEVPDRSLTVPRELQRRFLSNRLPESAADELSTTVSSLFNPDLKADERLKAADEVRELLRNQTLSDLRLMVNRRVDLVAAAVQAAQLESASVTDRDALNTIVVAANRFEDTCNAADADTVRRMWLQLKPNAAVMSVMRPVVMTHYFNHNVHVTLSEDMLSRFMSDYSTRKGTIAECILGAWVTGSQVTNASVSVDIKHSTGRGHFMLLLNGKTSSNTQGRRKPATIFTRGRHTFLIKAPVFFNGETLSTTPATIDVNANNQTVDVKTDLDGVPLFGHLARSIARRKAKEKRGQSEYIAAQKIAKRALPEFITELNDRLSEGNASIQEDLFAGLHNKGVGPDSISSRSSESHLAVSSRTMGTARLGGTAQPFAPLPSRGVAVQMHETAINNVIDGLEFGGRSIREDEFLDELSKSLSDLLQRDIALTAGESDGTAPADEQTPDVEKESSTIFTFDEKNPVRVRIEQDTIVLILQIRVTEQNKEPLPKHRIEIPIGIAVSGSDIVFSPPAKLTDIRATALERVSPLRRAGIANQIRRIVTAQLPERKVDGHVVIAASDTKTIDLQMIDISSHDGWLYVELQ